MKIYENPLVFNVLKAVAIIILIATFVLNYLSISLWDGDFWWHIATGRHIVETGSIPEKDPFSYTTAMEENKNPFPEWENFVLKQYWLSQIILYHIYDYAGPAGIIIFRTLLLGLTIIIVFWRLHKWRVSFPVSFFFVFLLYVATVRTTGERPVLFTIFFTAVVFFILEDFRENKNRRIFLLVPLMLVWANMHGGFIIGIFIVIAFLLGEGINIFRRKSVFTRNEVFLFYAASLLAIGITSINPTRWDAISIAINIPFKYKTIHQNIQEYYSIYYLYKYNISSLPYEYILLAALYPIIFFARNKSIQLTHIILLSFFLVPSISARRFMIYYMVIGAMILGKAADTMMTDLLKKKLSASGYKKIIFGLTFVSLISAGFYLAGNIHNSNPLRLDVARNYSVPVGAVDFIEKNKLRGNVFNDYIYGGYISWRLYPYHKTFIDTRALNITVRMEYAWILQANKKISDDKNIQTSKTPLWETLLNHYNINHIVLSPINIFSGEVYPLILELCKSDKWAPVYSDHISVIFVKNLERNKAIIEKNRLQVEEVYNTIIYRSINHALNNKKNPRSFVAVGDTFYEMKRLEDALKAYRYALEKAPDDSATMEKIRQLKSELSGKDRNETKQRGRISHE